MTLGLPRGDDTLREHLGYAIDLIAMSLRETVEPRHTDPDREWYRQMANIEVFWSQARILIEFFTGALASEKCAAAEHFTDGFVQYEFPKSRELKDKRNDQIAHMNYARTINMDEKLQPHDMYLTAGAIARAIARFETSLRLDARKVWNSRVSGHKKIEADLVYGSSNLTACTVSTSTSTVTGWSGTWGPTGPSGPPR
jgi:hypothetical protein